MIRNKSQFESFKEADSEIEAAMKAPWRAIGFGVIAVGLYAICRGLFVVAYDSPPGWFVVALGVSFTAFGIVWTPIARSRH
jgi:hypothetical protein